MKKNSARPTVVLNKSSPDGFLDFDFPSDFIHAVNALNKMKNSTKD